MANIIDKLIILLCCSIFYLDKSVNNIYFIIPILIVITLSSICSYSKNKYLPSISFVLYIIISIFLPEFIYYIPLVTYDVFFIKYRYLPILILIPSLVNLHKVPSTIYIFLCLITVMGYLLKKRTIEIHTLKNDYMNLRDDTKEFSDSLVNKNKELMEKQDYEVNLATLNERNRIAREIHDNVGHLLSSSLIQIGAVIAITKEEPTRELLTNVNKTLSSGMDSIRESIHNIHDDSIDLYARLNALVENFSFCNATLEYKIENELSSKAKYSILFIVKESLSNVMKHSNSTLVTIRLIEHPGLYQLIIQDNGNKLNKKSSSGIGLSSIEERVSTLGGKINISHENGFRIFISLTKQSRRQQ